MGAADQLVDRQPRHFAGDVPERDVDAGERLQRHPLLAVIAQQVVDPVPDRVAVQRVHAQNHRLDDLLDDGPVGERHGARPETLAPTGNSLVGLDLDDMGRALAVELLGISQLLRHVVLQHVAGDPGDLHLRVLRRAEAGFSRGCFQLPCHVASVSRRGLRCSSGCCRRYRAPAPGWSRWGSPRRM